jgi:hypothetical protein
MMPVDPKNIMMVGDMDNEACCMYCAHLAQEICTNLETSIVHIGKAFMDKSPPPCGGGEYFQAGDA